MRLEKKDAHDECASQNKRPDVHGHNKHTKMVKSLQALRDLALQKAVNYRFDPVIGQMHDEYYYMLSALLKGVQ